MGEDASWLCARGRGGGLALWVKTLLCSDDDQRRLAMSTRWTLALQLRDDIDTIIYPGHWGLFGGHVEPGETPAEAVQRELEEEISWSPSVPLQPWFSDASGTRTAHVFRGELTVPLDQLKLREGQDLRLASLEELRSEGPGDRPERRRSPRPGPLSCVICC